MIEKLLRNIRLKQWVHMNSVPLTEKSRRDQWPHNPAVATSFVMIDEEHRFHDGQSMHPRYLQTADMRMSTWRAKNWDLRLLALGTSLVVGINAYLGYCGVRSLLTNAYADRHV